MRDDCTPRPKADLDYQSLDLDPEEGFVLSRLDGSTSARDLCLLTGLGQERIQEILERLTSQGALEHSAIAASVEEPAAPPVPSDDEALHDGPRPRSWRRIFEEQLKSLDLDVRVERAAEATDEILRAFCFDPSRKVIEALLENPRFGLEHARLVANHHRSSQGLDALGHHAVFLRDQQVERHLFRNPQTSLRLLHRIYARARMAKVYRLATGHDAAEQVRESARREFRKKFSAGTPEERVKLILDTEARCLTLLVGLALDAKAAGLLRRRSLTSTLLLRNLARWPATPPPLLVHLVRQPQVKRNPSLRNLVLRHPNAPSELKRELHSNGRDL